LLRGEFQLLTLDRDFARFPDINVMSIEEDPPSDYA